MFRDQTIWAGIKWILMQLLPLRHVWVGEIQVSDGSTWYPAACVWRQWLGWVLWAEWIFDRGEVDRIRRQERTSAMDEIRVLPKIRCAEVQS